MIWKDHIPGDVADLFEVFDYGHAAAILAVEFAEHHHEICNALRAFKLTRAMIAEAGGNESRIPKLLSALLRPLGWQERHLRLSGGRRDSERTRGGAARHPQGGLHQGAGRA